MTRRLVQFGLCLATLTLVGCNTTNEQTSISADAVFVDCDMKPAFEHVAVSKDEETGVETKVRTEIMASSTGMPSLFYSANADVNTDGSPYSYHPEDPRANAGLALNNLGNAYKRLWLNDVDVTCAVRADGCYARVMAVYAEAKGLGFDPRAPTRFLASSVLGTKDGRPCILAEGPYKGYFVSPVAYPWDYGHEVSGDVCDPARYPNALQLNGNVLPSGQGWSSQGHLTDGFDLVVARNRSNGEIAFGFNADRGPAGSIGEVSVAMAAELKRRSFSVDLRGYEAIKRLAVAQVDYLVFPVHDVRRANKGQPFDQQFVNTYGAAVFAQWGGQQRLDLCHPLAGQPAS